MKVSGFWSPFYLLLLSCQFKPNVRYTQCPKKNSYFCLFEYAKWEIFLGTLCINLTLVLGPHSSGQERGN